MIRTNYQNYFFSLFLILTITACKNEKTENETTEQVHARTEIHNDDHVDLSLFKLLKSRDSLMFERSYNQVDMSVLEEMATDDLEFYHDQAGATYTKADFIKGASGLADLSYKARRELVEGSTKVFPMYNNGELYAAILSAEHRFYAKEPNEKPEYLTSSAKYTTLWVLVDDEWKMSRIYSFDHRSPE